MEDFVSKIQEEIGTFDKQYLRGIQVKYKFYYLGILLTVNYSCIPE